MQRDHTIMGEKDGQVREQGQLKDGVGAIVLAGGEGRRMQRADKGWVKWQGRPLIEQVLERVAPQVGEIIISANRNLSRYRSLGYPVVPDTITDYGGPLAGIIACAPHCHQRHTLIVPCDSPNLPASLRQRLFAALKAPDCRATYAHDGKQAQYLCCLVETAALLELSLRSNDHSVKGWLRKLDAEAVDFSDCAGNFININTL